MTIRRLAFLAVLSLSGCEAAAPFDSVAWKRDGGRRAESVRPLMIADFQRRYPIGSTKSTAIAALGASEASFPDICRERQEAEECLFYFAGVSGVDPKMYVVGLKGAKITAYWTRVL